MPTKPKPKIGNNTATPASSRGGTPKSTSSDNGATSQQRKPTGTAQWGANHPPRPSSPSSAATPTVTQGNTQQELTREQVLKTLQAKTVVLGGKEYVYDPDITVRQEELLAPYLRRVVAAIAASPSAAPVESGETQSALDELYSHLDVQLILSADGVFSNVLAILIIDPETGFVESKIPVILQKILKEKGANAKRIRELYTDFFILALQLLAILPQ